ncbi:MAG: anti-sigma factor [Actinomycetota bacterium]
MTHPQEHLAAYVDGTLEHRANAEVEAHLAGCATCREEVELARGARAVLRELPEVALPPETVRPSLAGGKPRGRDRRFGRTAWAASLAAAASIAGILALVISGPAGQSDYNAAERVPAPVSRTATDYDQQGIRKLAERLANRVAHDRRVHKAMLSAPTTTTTTTMGTGSSSGGGGGAETAPTPAPASSSSPASDSVSSGGTGTFDQAIQPRVCLARGARLPDDTKPIELIEARYEGAPVYIGAFLQDGALPDRLVLWVVSTKTCRVVTTVEQLI